MKTDKTIHAICIASIKRSTFKPYTYKWTQFYESNSDFSDSGFGIDLLENELVICSTEIDSNNFSILTTRKLVTTENGIKNMGDMQGAQDTSYGLFKSDTKAYTFGIVTLKNGTELKYFIETGKASMIMIHGVRTLVRTQDMTAKNIQNVTNIWNRKNKENGK